MGFILKLTPSTSAHVRLCHVTSDESNNKCLAMDDYTGKCDTSLSTDKSF